MARRIRRAVWRKDFFLGRQLKLNAGGPKGRSKTATPNAWEAKTIDFSCQISYTAEVGKVAGGADSEEAGARRSRCKLLIDIVDTSIRELGASLQDEGAFPYFVESDVQVDLSCRLRTNLERSGLLVVPAAGIFPGLPVRDRKVSRLHTEFGGRTKLEAVRYDIALLDTDEGLDAYYWPVVVGIEIKFDFFWNPKKIIDGVIYDARKGHDPRVEVVLLYCCASSQMAVEDVDRSIGKDIREHVKKRSYLVWPKGMWHYSPD